MLEWRFPTHHIEGWHFKWRAETVLKWAVTLKESQVVTGGHRKNHPLTIVPKMRCLCVSRLLCLPQLHPVDPFCNVEQGWIWVWVCVCVNIFKWLLCGAAAAKRWNTLAKLQHCSTKLNVCVYVLWKTSFYLKSQMYGGTAADKWKVNDMEEALHIQDLFISSKSSF